LVLLWEWLGTGSAPKSIAKCLRGLLQGVGRPRLSKHTERFRGFALSVKDVWSLPGPNCFGGDAESAPVTAEREIAPAEVSGWLRN